MFSICGPTINIVGFLSLKNHLSTDMTTAIFTSLIINNLERPSDCHWDEWECWQTAFSRYYRCPRCPITDFKTWSEYGKAQAPHLQLSWSVRSKNSWLRKIVHMLLNSHAFEWKCDRPLAWKRADLDLRCERVNGRMFTMNRPQRVIACVSGVQACVGPCGSLWTLCSAPIGISAESPSAQASNAPCMAL